MAQCRMMLFGKLWNGAFWNYIFGIAFYLVVMLGMVWHGMVRYA